VATKPRATTKRTRKATVAEVVEEPTGNETQPETVEVVAEAIPAAATEPKKTSQASLDYHKERARRLAAFNKEHGTSHKTLKDAGISLAKPKPTA